MCCVITANIFAPMLAFIGAMIVSTLTYHGITVKIKKDRKTNWIEDFRIEVADFVSFIVRNPAGADLQSLYKAASLLLLRLDTEKPLHDHMNKNITEVVNKLVKQNTAPRSDEFNNEMGTHAADIIEAAQLIIEEMEKIHKL